MSKVNIMYYDLETSYLKAESFGIWNVNIPVDNILEDWHIICAAWVFNDNKTIKAVSGDEKKILLKLSEAFKKADVIVAHNGAKFDWKKFNTRLLVHGLPPVDKPQEVDTLKAVKKHFGFTSNRLDYIGKVLDVGRKIENEKGLWSKVGAGSKSALKRMVAYNKQDVILLRDVYKKLLPFITNHPNINVFRKDGLEGCPNCGSSNLTKDGTRATRTGLKQRYHCQSCGAKCQGKKAIKQVNIR